MTYLRRIYYVPFLSAAYLFCTNCFLSHLLIAGCDIGVQISVRPSVRPSIFTSKFGFPYISDSCEYVIVLDIPFKHTPWPGALVSWPPKPPKYFPVGIFEYILASMTNVCLNVLQYTLGWMPSLKMPQSPQNRSKVN